MIVNETKHQVLILGKTDYSFSFPAVKESIGMFGMNIDNKLNFSNHIRTMWKKISKQFQVMLRFRNLISRDALLKLQSRPKTMWTVAFDQLFKQKCKIYCSFFNSPAPLNNVVFQYVV